MSLLLDAEAGSRHLVMGNDAISRGALEAGVSVVAGYPGTPSSEIIEGLSKVSRERNLYVEWSVNEKVALEVTIGEIFGASQRGGSVMSHLRISGEWTLSPQIPKRMAHAVVALEPTEAIRVLKDYGNPRVKVLCNMRPVHAVGVICGEKRYPELEQLRKWIEELSETAWFIDATDKALALGSPIFANIISVGALAATGLLPLDRGIFESVLSLKMTPDKVAVNLAAFDAGAAMVKAQGRG